ncbi:T9SS type A sorting domain-containing protein [bacterium]|nr:T9SS type A sorting domain-containing protein [bacterium]
MGLKKSKLAALLLLVALPLAAKSQTLVQIPDQVVNSGETVEVPLVVQDFNDVAVFEMYIDYSSSVLEYVSMTGPTPSPVVNDVGGRTIISWLSTNLLSLEDGETLMTLTYQVNGAPGESTVMDFTSSSYLADENSLVIPTTFEDGQIEVFNPQPPAAFNLVSPANGALLTTLTPELVWNATTDPNPDDVPTYNIYLDTQADLSTMQLVGEGVSEASFSLDALIDDETYYWTVFATDVNTDGTWASDTLSFSTAVPDPPSAFSLITPAEDDTLNSTEVFFQWEASVDPDPGENVVYDVYIDTDADMAEAVPLQSLITDTEFTSTIEDGLTYYWTVHAIDASTLETISSDTVMFVVNEPDQPLDFAYVSPSDGAELNEPEVTVLWRTAEDSDLADLVIYRIEWGTDPEFAEYFETTTTDTTYTITDLANPANRSKRLTDSSGRGNGTSEPDDLPDNSTVFWRVVAIDRFGLETVGQENQAWSFTVELPNSPEAFTLLTPEDETILESLDTWLTWEATIDPDDVERLQHYDVWLDTQADLSTAQLIADSLGDIEHFIAELEDDQNYYWTVRATDDNTAGRWASDTLSFSTAYPEAPLAFTLISPEEGAEISATSATLTWNATTDPDPDQIPTYDVWLDTFPDLSTGQTVASGLTGTEFTVEDLLDDHTYYWAVHATDSNTPGTYSDTLSFVTNQPELPSEFSLLTPLEDDTVWAGLDTTLTWEASVDPDLDQVPFYDVWLDTLADLSTAELVADSIEPAEFLIADLLDDHTYYWTVRATDINSPGRWASDTLFFHTYMPEQPTAFSLAAPADSTVISFDPPFDVELFWHPSVDPDPEQTVTYDITCVVSSNFAEDSTFVFAGIADTSYVINIPDSLHIETWPDTINALWHVDAIAAGDTVRSTETWLIIYAPPLDVAEGPDGLPLVYGIQSAYPNPFNPTMTVEISLPQASPLRVEAFDVLGRRVALLHQGRAEAGVRQFVLDGSSLSSGAYFVRATVPGKMNQVRKVVLMK